MQSGLFTLGVLICPCEVSISSWLAVLWISDPDWGCSASIHHYRIIWKLLHTFPELSLTKKTHLAFLGGN